MILRELRRREADADRASFLARYPAPGDLALGLAPHNSRQTPALEAIDRELTRTVSGDVSRLMVFCPPQEGKSTRTACWYPLWLLAQDPTTRVAIVSYSQQKAVRWGRWLRQMIMAHPGLGVELTPGSRAADRFETTAGGKVISVGIEGGITGESVDCLHGRTLIETDRGPVSIRDLHHGTTRPRVLTVNHATGRTEWRRIQATRAIPDRPLVEVLCASGRRVVCTPDHRFHVPDGYRQAHLLRPGDRLTVRRPEPDANLPRLRNPAQGHRPAMPPVLAESAGRGGDTDPDLLGVRCVVHADARGAGEGDPGRNPGDVLLAPLSRRLQEDRRTAVRPMRTADRVEGSSPSVLRRGVQDGGPGRTSQDQALPALRQGLCLLQRATDLLRPALRQRRSLAAHGGYGELPLQGRDQLCGMVPPDKADDQGARQLRVRRLRSDRQSPTDYAARADRHADGPAGAPHQRGPGGQPARESDHAVRDVPRGAPQVDGDTVALVRRLRGQRDTVYDLQVEGNHNFFAGEVLVHNCLIIDDPVRGRAEAESRTYRDHAWEWWESNAMTRASNRFKVVLMMTRFHADDLAGRLLREEPGDWKVLRIPAIREDGVPVVRGNEGQSVYHPNGELISVQDRPEGWFHKLRAMRSAYVWRSVYAQNPVAAEGNLFRKTDFRYWKRATPNVSRHDGVGGARIRLGADGELRYLSDMRRFLTVDLAASTKTSADWTVAAVWAITGDGLLILLDQARDRVEESNHFALVRPLSERWAAPDVYVEKGFIGSTLVIDATRAGLRIRPLSPDRDKVTRAIPATNRVRAGRVWFPAEDVAGWLGDWIAELAEFPSGEFDDRVDCLAYAARVMAAEWLEPEGRPTPRTEFLAPDPTAKAYESATGSRGLVDIATADW